MNPTGTSTLVKTIDEEIEKYLGVYQNRTRENSYKRMELSLNHFIKSYGSGKDIADMDDEHIEKFIEYSRSIGHADGGINLNLRNIKSFLKWCDRRKPLRECL